MMSQRRFTLLSLQVALTFSCFISSHAISSADSSSHTDASLPTFTANYKANIKGFAVNAKRELTALDNGQFKLSFNATSWAAEMEETSVFSWSNKHIQPLQYRYSQSALGKKRYQHLDFDTLNNTVKSDHDGESQVIEKTKHTLDKLNYQLQLQQDLLANKGNLSYIIVDKGGLKNYRFEQLEEEVLTTQSGQLNTVKVKVIREDNSKTTYIWFAKEWGYLLTRLEQYNGDKQTLSITLDNATVNGVTVNGVAANDTMTKDTIVNNAIVNNTTVINSN